MRIQSNRTNRKLVLACLLALGGTPVKAETWEGDGPGDSASSGSDAPADDASRPKFFGIAVSDGVASCLGGPLCPFLKFPRKPADVPRRRREAPPVQRDEGPLREPEMDPLPAPRTMTDLARAIGTNLTGFRAGDEFCKLAAGRVTQAGIDQFENVARRVGAPLATTLESTRKGAIESDAAMRRFDSLVSEKNGNGRMQKLVPWVTSYALGSMLCGKEKLNEQQAHRIAVGLVHFATSVETMRKVLVEGFRYDLSTTRLSELPTEQRLVTAFQSALGRAVTKLKPLETPLPAFGSGVAVRGAALGLKCSTQPVLVQSNGLSVVEQGAVIADDSRILLSVNCKNESRKRWTSESLVAVATPSCAVDESTRRGDIVLPELEPGESTNLAIGPLLITRQCPSDVLFQYAVRSSTVAESQALDVSLRVMQPQLSVRLDFLDEDTPGSSVDDNNRGYAADDDFELRIALNPGQGGIEPEMSRAEIVGDTAQVVAQFPLAADVPLADGWWGLHDDLDVKVTQIGQAGTGDVLVGEPGYGWLETGVQMATSCELSARQLEGTAAEPWARICRYMPWSRFVAWSKTMHATYCAMKPRAKGAKGPSGSPPKLPELDPSTLVDPTYADVAEALKRLVKEQAIAAADLEVGLATLDRLVDSPLFKDTRMSERDTDRERARQILIADYMLRVRGELGLQRPSPPAAIFGDASARRIASMPRELYELYIQAQLARATAAAAPAERSADDDDGSPAALFSVLTKAAAKVATKAVASSDGLALPASPAERALVLNALAVAGPNLAKEPCDQELNLATPATPTAFELQRFVLVPRERGADPTPERFNIVRTEGREWLDLETSVVKALRALEGARVRVVGADGKNIDGRLKSVGPDGARILIGDGSTTLAWGTIVGIGGVSE